MEKSKAKIIPKNLKEIWKSKIAVKIRKLTKRMF